MLAEADAAFLRTRDALSRTIPSLDGVRGIAILLVLFGHLIGWYPVKSSFDRGLFAIFRSGWCGVDLFFVLSGFLITGILLDTRSASNRFSAFYMRRFLRIFPLYYLFLFGWFVVVRALMESRGMNIDVIGLDRQRWYWLYAANWLPAFNTPAVGDLGHMWSLAVEEQFYLVWPLIVWCMRPRRLSYVCLAIIVLSPIARALLISRGFAPTMIYEATATRADALAFGALTAVALRDRVWQRVAFLLWRRILAATSITLALLMLALDGLSFGHPVVQIAGYSLLGIAGASTIVGAVAMESSDRPSFLRARPLRAFGKYSYAIYIVHYTAFCIATQYIQYTRIGAMIMQSRLGYSFVFMPAGIVAVFGISLASWNLFEKHFLVLKARFAPRMPDAESAAARATA